MGWLLVAIFLFLAYMGVRMLAKFASWLTGSRFKAYRQLAGHYRGRYENRGMSDPPTVSFTHNGSTVRVGLAPNIPGQANYARTRVVARFREGIPFRMELSPINRPAPSQPPKGTRPVRVGDAEFDRAFLVLANDPEMARDALTAPVRWAVSGLLRLGPPGGVLVSVNPERMLVQVDRNLGATSTGLGQAVQEALTIHDGLLQGVAARMGAGVEIVEAGPAAAEDAGPPICRFCGEPADGVELAVVRCASCKTPQHRDCWDFAGGCSIFGCKGKTALSA